MSKYYLAIDIGASSGRHMLSYMQNGIMKLEEIYRFPNELIKKDNELCWDLEKLYFHIIAGMKKCQEIGKIPYSVGVDTWAVDFVLLDQKDQVIGNTVAYRDNRTQNMDKLVYEKITEEALYERTGIQKQIFNSIYQLMAWKQKKPVDLDKAETFLMIPDYFHFLLCGKKGVEYTNASTTQLLDPDKKTWDRELIKELEIPEKIFPSIVLPGTTLGDLKECIQKEIGYSCKVVVPATHDTASAVMAVPAKEENALYISSGTWSLLGIERMRADCSDLSRKRNFTNEGGYEYRFRYLKNIMGLWMIQSVKKEIGQNYSFGEICEMASHETIASIVDCNESRFLAPENMSIEVQQACRDSKQEVPQGIAQISAVIYNSLALCYEQAIKELEEITKETYQVIHVVGGGANASYLNELTAKRTKRIVYAGPTEATAIGNAMAQMISANEFRNLKEARACVFDSFDIIKYES